MTKNNSTFAVVVGSVLLLGLVLTIMQGITAELGSTAAESRPLEQRVTTATPAVIAAAITPTPLQKRAIEPKADRPTQTAVESSFNFTDAVPAADSPEFAADDMRACFSMYTRNKNTAENTCKGEWYPADMKPRPHDEYWCATNSGRVGWLPVRLFDNRASEIVKPYGSLNQCN